MVKRTQKSGQRKVIPVAAAAAAAAVNKGAWTSEEDQKLFDYVMAHGDKKWRTLPAKAGLNRCGKSCRLRWLNYLRPGIKRGNISEDEEDLIIRLHNLIGNRWSLIAGRLPGRTDNEIKNFWNTHLSKKSLSIIDLNTKLNLKLESINNDNNTSLFASSSDFSVLPSEPNQRLIVIPDVPHDHSNTDNTTAILPDLELETQVVDKNHNIDVTFETCPSPSEIWFEQPFFSEEYPSYDNVCTTVDMMMDYQLYFP